MPSRFLLSDSPPPSDDPDLSAFNRNMAIGDGAVVVVGAILIFFLISWVITVRAELRRSQQREGAGNPVNPRPGVDALPVHRPPAGAGNRAANPRQEAPPVRVHHHRSPPPPPPQPARAVDGLPFLEFSDKTRRLVEAAEEGCVICLSEFESGEGLIVLPECKHGFHVMCIERWRKEFHSCPTCRTMY